MHTLHDYVAKQLADKIKARGVVVWCDKHREVLEFALEGRRRVKEQPKQMGSFEYSHTSFSYSVKETGEKEVHNPAIAMAMRRIGMCEQAGTGLRMMQRYRLTELGHRLKQTEEQGA